MTITENSMMKTMKMRNRKEYKADAAERVAGLVSKKQRLSIVRTLLIAIMFLALPLKTFAQWGFDVSSVEAYINDHKKQRSLLLARSTLSTATSCCTATAMMRPRHIRN